MDPVCHTLVGGALAQSGLKRRTGLGMATLLIGANVPDVDVLSFVGGPTMALWFRRGVTHGILALVVWPVVLTGLMLLWDRVVRRRRRGSRPPALPRELLFLSCVAVATHPVLDFLNTYGMRWLMPFSDTWSFGDTLFIVDPWIWAVLAAGIFLAARAGRGAGASPLRSPAALALVVVVGYVALMGLATVAARGAVRDAMRAARLPAPTRIMVSPLPVIPWRRWVVMEVGDEYRFGSFAWLRRPMLELQPVAYPRGPTHPAAAAATRGPEVRRFLSWARFPYFQVEERRDAYLVHLGDARYTVDPTDSWAAITVRVEK